MAVQLAAFLSTGWYRPSHSLRDVARQVLGRARGASTRYLGLPAHQFLRRLPSLIRGAALQIAACYARPAAYSHRGGPAVMLVPGLFCTPSVMNRLGRELERFGLDVYLPRPFPYFHGLLANAAPVERSAAILLNDLERLRADAGVSEITLVGHSLGGLIALAAALKAKTSARSFPAIRGIVLLATPLAGTPVAAPLAPLVPACRDLRPGAETLERLRPAVRDVQRIVASGFDSLVPAASQQAVAVETLRFDDFQHTDFYVGSPEQVARVAWAIVEVVRGSTASTSSKKAMSP